MTACAQDLYITPPFVRHWTDESIPDLLDLTRIALGSGQAVAKTQEFWRWKHCDSPFGRSYGIYACAGPPSQVAALRILLRWEFVSGQGRKIRAARAVDTATHPDFQRQGLFSRLTQQAVTELREDGTALIFNTPNDKSWPGYQKLGWMLVDKRKMYICPLRPDRMLLRKVGLTSTLTTVDPTAYFGDSSTVPWRVFVGTHGEEAWSFMQQWEAQRKSVGWRTKRSEAYYAWRYGRHPNVTYYVHSQFEGVGSARRLAGLAVLRANVRHGWQEIVLCDLVLASRSVEAGRRFVYSLAKAVQGDYIVAHFAEGTVEHQCLRKSGYLPIPGQGMRLAVRPLSDVVEDIVQPTDWDLSLGDLEIF